MVNALLGNSSGVVDGSFFTATGTTTQASPDTFLFKLDNGFGIVHLNLFNIVGGDADVELYEDTNSNGILDDNDRLLGESRRGGTQEEVIKVSSDSNLNKFIKVFPFSDSNNVQYSLSLTSTQNIGTNQVAINLTPNSTGTFSDFLFPDTEFHAIEYTTSTNGVIFGQLTTNFGNPIINLKVFDDSNSNDIFDTRDQLLSEQRIEGAGFVAIPVEQGRGFVQLERLSGDGQYEIIASYANAGTTDTSPLTLRRGTAQIAYVAYYGRPADPSGVNFWNTTLGNNNVNYSPRRGDVLTGNTKRIYDRIVNDFGNSAEADRLFRGMSNREKVNQVYNFAFDRNAETQGLNYWTNQLNNGAVTLASFALEVALGAQNQDIIVLRNKITSADLFSNSINTVQERNAYQGAEAEIFGRNWLDPINTFTTTQNQVDSALAALV